MTTIGADPRIAAGLRAQDERRRSCLAAGEQRLGWKAGLGSPAHLELLGTDGPLVGFLTDGGRIDPGATWSLAGRVAPHLEPEIAARIGADLSIAALAPAIELVDIDLPLADPEPVLAGNIFHRAVVLGAFREVDEVGALTVRADGQTWVAGADPLALIGDLAGVVARVAAVVGETGDALRAGDVVITGSAVPPIALAGPAHVEVAYAGLGAVAVRVTG